MSTLPQAIRPLRVARPPRFDRAAVRDMTPIALSLLPFAAILGVTIAQSRVVPTWVGLLSGPLLFAGSAQLAALTLLDSGAGPVAVVATVLVVNARLTMYGAALEPRFRDQPTWFRWLGPHYLVDQMYALVDARPGLAGGGFRRYWLTAGAVLLVGWMTPMTAGALGGDLLPRRTPLEFASTAVIVALLVPRLRARRARLPALLAATVAVLASGLPFGLGILAGAITGLVTSLLTDRSSR
jgi:predicted branched-subunit amino acid permease